MRTPLAIAIGVCVGAAAAGVVFVATNRTTPRVEDGQRVARADAPVAVVAPIARPDPLPSKSVPTTPDYGPRRAGPPAIYRCRTTSGTQYSNEPCAGGSIVDESSAVTGYDTRPSDRLARLVAEGRVADAPRQPVYRALALQAAETGECAAMRQQIIDLDATMRRPNDAKRLDEWRVIRQDVRTSMARLHC